MMNHRWQLLAFAILATTILSPNQASAQVAGATLSGTISDASGAVIPAVLVSIRDAATGIIRTVAADSAGLYTAPNLRPSTYEVTVSFPGFRTQVQSGITLTVGAEQVLNFTMQVGQTAEALQVIGEPPLVELATSTLSASVASTTVRELPLNGRDWTALATLQPGVASVRTQQQPLMLVGGSQGARGLGMQLTVGGNRPTQNSYRLDGGLVNDYSNAGPGSVLGANLGVDAIQEFTVLTSTYSAEYGFTSGGVINAVTRSGTNSFHGTAFDFLRNDKFDAANFFDNANGIPKSVLRQNQFGLSASGPVVKNTVFLFGDYEGVRYVRGIPTSNTTLSGAAHSSPCTSGLTAPCASVSRYIGTPPAPVTTTVSIDPIIQKFLAFYPLPTPGSAPVLNSDGTVNLNVGLFNYEAVNRSQEDFYTARGDWKVANNDSFFTTFVHDKSNLAFPLAFNSTLAQNFSYRESIIAEETHTLSPAFVNSFRVAVTRTRSDGNNTPKALNPVAGDTTLAQAQGPGIGPPSISLGGTGVNPTSPQYSQAHQDYGLQSGQIYDDAFSARGNHNFKYGFSFIRLWNFAYNSRGGNGGGSFGGSYTPPGGGPAIAGAAGALLRFLTNHPLRATRYADYPNIQKRYVRDNVIGVYLQDDWRFRSNLTLNLGLRYEMATLPTEKYGRVAYLNSFLSRPDDLTNQILPRNVTTKNFEPRIGFAWDPFSNGKTAVRGSFGLFDALPLPYELNLTLIGNAPLQPFFPGVGQTLNYGGQNFDVPPGTWPYSVPNLVVRALATPQGTQGRKYGYRDTNIKRNYIYQYNLNIQRQLTPSTSFTIAYAGSRGLHNPIQLDATNGVIGRKTPAGYVWPVPWTYCSGPDAASGCTAAGGGLSAAPNPNVGPIQAVIWASNSYYNSLQLRLDRRLSRGLQVQGSFTWGKSLDHSSASFAGDAFQNSVATIPSYDMTLSKGLSDFDIRRVLVVNALWNAPAPKSLGAFGKRVLGGWQFGTISTLSDGVPFSIVAGADGNDILGEQQPSFNPPNVVAGCSRFINRGNPDHYINLDCFGLPQQSAATISAGCDTTRAAAMAAAAGASGIPGLASSCPNIRGNLGRNTLIGPGLVNFDFSAFKNNYFPKISESFNVQFRTEFFNLFNRANFAPPTSLEVINSSGAYVPLADKILATQTPGRVIQFALKIIW
jgi:hypothetical protein